MIDDGARQRRPGPALRASPGCSSCRSTRSTSSPPSPRSDGRRGAADPGPARLLAHRPRRSPRRPTPPPPACSTPAPAAGRRRCSRRSASRPGCCPTSSRPGEVLGPAHRRRSARSSGSDYALPVTTVGSHDTASAVVGVPARDGPVRLHLLRHLGAGRRRARRAGAHRGQPAGQLHQRARRRRHDPLPAQRDGAVAAAGVDAHLGPARARRRPGRRCCAAAAALPAGGPRIDPDDPVFLPPGDMPAPDRRAACRRWAAAPEPAAEVVRCILDSLAARVRRDDRPTPSGCPGDPSRSCTSSAAARRTRCCASSPPTPAGCRWSPGPVEATALGNVLVQARTHGVLSGDLAALRGRVRAASRLHRYEPR